jgi:hypothetical protein
MQKTIESFQFVGSTTPNRRVCIVERHPISYVAPVTSILELYHYRILLSILVQFLFLEPKFSVKA